MNMVAEGLDVYSSQGGEKKRKFTGVEFV